MKFTRLLLAGCMALAVAAPAVAQTDFPKKPIKIVVPFSAGGVVDIVARTVGEKLSTRLGQPVIIENRTGAGGAIGEDYVARAAPDGYTLLAVSPSHAVLPSLQKGITWNPVRDFKAVGGFGIVPNVIVVYPGVPVKTLADFIEMAKKSPTPVTYATAGLGTSNHLSGELLAQEAGIKLTQVPYKGQPEAMTDLLGGRVTMMPMTVALALPQIKAGKLRPLAVTTARRVAALPDVPTVAEAAKLPNYEVGTWFGFVAPAKTPDPVLHKLATEVAAVMAEPDVRAKLESVGMVVAPQSAPEFDAYLAKEFTKWSRVMKQAGVEAN